MNRLLAAALVVVLWALIYLPGLGSTELKGEEGRRILPAITMLETGNYVIPYVGGEPYLRKPPLINWVIAASFHLTGVQNEWTARLPSALCVLALGLVIVALGRSQSPGYTGVELSIPAAFAAAVMAMTGLGLLAKARFAGAEIEGLYAPLSGLAMVWWLAGWGRKASPWVMWLPPGILMGIACLAKGPSWHLVFFYILVIGVVAATKEWRALLHPAHFVALLLGAGIFAAWAVPFFQSPEAVQAAAVWKRQGIDRFTDSEFKAENYFTNLPRGIADELPWILLAVPLLGLIRRGGGSREERTLRGAAWAIIGTFVAVLLIPGSLPRYTLPLAIPFAWLIAAGLSNTVQQDRWFARWHGANRIVAGLVMLGALAAPFVPAFNRVAGESPLPAMVKTALVSALVLAFAALILARRAQGLTLQGLTTVSGGLMGAGMALFAVCLIPIINRTDDLRPLAREIDQTIPPGQTLAIYKPGYLAASFYLQTPYREAPAAEFIPPEADWILARNREQTRLNQKQPDFALVKTLKGREGDEFLLLQRRPENQKLPTR